MKGWYRDLENDDDKIEEKVEENIDFDEVEVEENVDFDGSMNQKINYVY